MKRKKKVTYREGLDLLSIMYEFGPDLSKSLNRLYIVHSQLKIVFCTPYRNYKKIESIRFQYFSNYEPANNNKIDYNR